MDERRQQRIEITGCGQADADRIDNQRAVEILQDNSAATFCHANGFNELHEVVADQHHIRAFAGDIGSRTHGHANSGFTQSGCVVNAVAEHGHHSPFPNLFRDLRGFLLRKKIGVNIADTELAGHRLARSAGYPQ